MKLSDRIKRWWSPAKWRDEHPEVSEGEGFALDAEQRLTVRAIAAGEAFPKDTVGGVPDVSGPAESLGP